MPELLLVTFTFGIAIFTFLSMLEIPVWKLIFTGQSENVSEASIRFVHRNLKFMTSKLPPANGGVIIAGLGLMIWQGTETSWTIEATWLLCIYLAGLFLIVAILRNPRTVFSIRSHDSDASSLELLKADLKNVGRDHHLGLALNLIALIIQLVIVWS